MQQVVVIGCGVIGAMIAYELSHCPNLHITVLDRQPPAQDSTGAALGVLMGIISQKVSGRAWAMRQESIRRYATLLPELATGTALAWNRQGILKLCFADDDLERWQQIIQQRHDQGWPLEFWTASQVQQRCPQVQAAGLAGAIYSPQDYQVDPTALTLALVEAARQRQVQFRFDAAVERLISSDRAGVQHCHAVQTATDEIAADWVVVAAGLGSTALIQTGQQPITLRPVLGQAMRIRLEHPLGDPAFQPVITGHDIHLVPLGHQEYWVGATVEFPGDFPAATNEQSPQSLPIEPVAERLEAVWQGAVSLWPALVRATRLKTWFGLRPRPDRRPAPVVEPLVGYTNVWLATGHYRNGVLLAPATAQLIRAALTAD